MFRLAQKGHGPVEDASLAGFFASQPRVLVTEGAVSLFRDRSARAQPPEAPATRSTVVAIAVPSYIAPCEILARLEPFAALLRDPLRILVSLSHSFFCVADCQTQDVADQLHAAFHLQPFTPQCHEYLVGLFLDAVDVDPTEPPAPWVHHSLQLPSCLICLERLESSISGQISTMCNHSNSCDCIHKSQCTVCRLVNTGWMDPRCQECGAAVRHQPGQSVPRTETVWCCLLCGFQGCDRYGKQHALEHARTRGHNYCIDLQSQRIWDYEGDCFVHRLIYNRAECQLEYLPDAHDGAPPPMGKELVDAKLDAKVEAITTEYTHMLTNQMEEQRRVYLALLASQRKRHGETLCTTKADLELLHTGQLRELQALEMARRAKAEREEHAASARRVAQELTDKIRRLEESNRMAMTQRDELKAEILSFATSQKASKDKATALVKDLQQEIADLEGHFRALAMVEKHELKGDIGRGIIIPTGPVCGSGKRKGRSGRR